MMDYDVAPRLFPSGWAFRPLKRRLSFGMTVVPPLGIKGKGDGRV